MKSLIQDISNKYNPIETWFYDKFIATSILEARVVEEAPLNELPDKAKVLDVGCGGGQIAIQLGNDYPSFQITAVDLAKTQIKRAKKRNIINGNQVSFQLGDACSLPFPSNSFDFVYSIASIKHWPDRKAGIEECYRVLNSNGILLIMEVDRNCSDEGIKEFVEKTTIPEKLKPLWRKVYKNKIVKPSISIEELKRTTQGLDASFIDIQKFSDSMSLKLILKKQ